LVGRQAPIGKRDLVRPLQSRETEFHAALLKPGSVMATRIAANGGIRYWAPLGSGYRLRQSLPNFELVHRRTNERWQARVSVKSCLLGNDRSWRIVLKKSKIQQYHKSRES
jgi:hypothetical protein